MVRRLRNGPCDVTATANKVGLDLPPASASGLVTNIVPPHQGGHIHKANTYSVRVMLKPEWYYHNQIGL